MKKFAPYIFLVLLSLVSLAKLITGPVLAFGDNPLSIPGITRSSFLYSWEPDNFGTTIRQGLFSIRDLVLLAVSNNSHTFYILSFLLPLLILAPIYYYLLTKLKVKSALVKIIAGLTAIINPVVFGDFSKAQTFWVYLTIPWVIYYVILIFYLLDTKLKNFIFLAIFLFLSFGFLPPIIIPLVAVSGLIALSAILLKIIKHEFSVKGFRSILLGSGLSLIIFTMLSIPYVVVASPGQSAFAPVSLLGDYYNDYSSTTLSNTLRLAGNNGNGISILGFNKFSYINAFGYVFIALILLALCSNTYRRKNLSVVLLIPLLFFLGLLNILATNISLGTKIFESQFVVSTIRDPTKIFEIMLPLLVILFSFAIDHYYNSLEGIKRSILASAVIIFVLIYGWPVFTGNLGILKNRNTTIASYAPDKFDAGVVANEASNKQSRAIILPSDHRDELNYQAISPSLDSALRLGGTLPYTTQLVNELQAGVDGDGYFAKLLNIANIKDAYLKQDQGSYRPNAFGLLSSSDKLTAQQLLTSSLNSPIKVTNSYQLYVNNNLQKTISSGSKLVSVDGTSQLHDILPVVSTNNLTIDDVPKDYSSFSTNFHSAKSLPKSSVVKAGVAQLYSPSILQLTYNVNNIAAKRELQIYESNPVNNSKKLVYSSILPNNTSELIVDGSIYSLKISHGSLSLHSGYHSISVATEKALDVSFSDPSFEKSNKVYDASQSRPGSSGILSKLDNDSTDGLTSLLIGTSNHLAYATKTISVPSSSANYLVSFDYKYLKGSAPSFGVYQNNNLVAPTQTALQKDPNWSTQNLYFKLPNNDKFFDANFYVNSINKTLSESLFDNLKVYQLLETRLNSMSLSSYSPDYQLSNYTVQNNVDTTNYISNGSFENNDLWGDPGDATINSLGEPNFSSSQDTDSYLGKYSLKLQSHNHTAYVSRDINNFNVNQSYKVSFYYKNISGLQPTFTLWEDGLNKAKTYSGLTDSSSWTHYEYTFTPDPGATNVSIYLYSPSTGQNTINLFDDVSITKQPAISNYLIKTTDQTTTLTNIVKGFKIVSPTQIDITAHIGNGIVQFNQSYHVGWRAYIVSKNFKTQSIVSYLLKKPPGYLLPLNSHVIAEGYANAWLINSKEIPKNDIDNEGNYNVVLEYWPQRSYTSSLIVSGVTLIGCLGYLSYAFIRPRWKPTKSKSYKADKL